MWHYCHYTYLVLQKISCRITTYTSQGGGGVWVPTLPYYPIQKIPHSRGGVWGTGICGSSQPYIGKRILIYRSWERKHSLKSERVGWATREQAKQESGKVVSTNPVSAFFCVFLRLLRSCVSRAFAQPSIKFPPQVCTIQEK